MDIAAVEEDLRARIADGKAWFESGESLFLDGLKVREFPSDARLVAVLDDQYRVEQQGLKFLVTIHGRTKDIRVHVNVRVKPKASVGAKADSPPYVVVYVVNQRSEADEEILHEHLVQPNLYKSMAQLSVQKWYRAWLQKALLSKHENKLFLPEMAIE